MRTIRIRNKDIALSLTVRAYMEICELCGNTDKLKDWLGGNMPTERLKKIIGIMAKADCLRRGETPKEIDFPVYFNSSEITGAYFGIFSEIGQGFYHEIPPKVKTNPAETDFDLEHVLDHKAKERGIKRPNKALSVIATGLGCGLGYTEILDRFTPGEIMQVWLYQLEMKGGA